MKHLAIIVPAALALSACGGGQPTAGGDVSLTNASAEEVAAATQGSGVAQAAFNPGQWETRYEIVSLEMPGMAPAMKDQMNKMMAGKVTTDKSCMTPEEAKNPRAKMFSGDAKSDCTFRHFTMAGGKIDAEMVCPGGGRGGETVMKMDGSFGADQYQMDANAAVSGGPAPMKMSIRLSGKRVGDCPAN